MPRPVSLALAVLSISCSPASAALDAGGLDAMPNEAEAVPNAGPGGNAHPALPDEGNCRAGTAGAGYGSPTKCSDLSLVGRSFDREVDTTMSAPVGHGGSIVDGHYTVTAVFSDSQPTERCIATYGGRHAISREYLCRGLLRRRRDFGAVGDLHGRRQHDHTPSDLCRLERAIASVDVTGCTLVEVRLDASGAIALSRRVTAAVEAASIARAGGAPA